MLRCVAPRGNAYIDGSDPANARCSGIGLAPSDVAASAIDWNPRSGIGGTICPGRSGTMYVARESAEWKYRYLPSRDHFTSGGVTPRFSPPAVAQPSQISLREPPSVE